MVEKILTDKFEIDERKDKNEILKMKNVAVETPTQMRHLDLKHIAWQIDPIQSFLMAIKAQKMPVFAEALNRNMSGLFYKFINYKVEHKEVISIEAKGAVRSGKSTGGISIGKYISTRTHVPFTLDFICPNEQYYNQLIPTAVDNSTIVIDEQLEQHTGIGAFREMQHTEDLNNIIAKRCIHSIWIHPNEFVGRNAGYGLETCGRNFEHRLTKFLLYDLTQKTFGISSFPLGFVIVPKYNDKAFEDAYEAKKDEHIEELRGEHVNVRQQRKLDMGFALARSPLYKKLKNVHQKLQLAQQLFPMLTIGEYQELIAIAKMNADLNISQKDFDDAKKNLADDLKDGNMIDAERAEKLQPNDEIDLGEDDDSEE